MAIFRALWCSPRYEVYSSIVCLPSQDLKVKMSNNNIKILSKIFIGTFSVKIAWQTKVAVKIDMKTSWSHISGVQLSAQPLTSCLILISLVSQFPDPQNGVENVSTIGLRWECTETVLRPVWSTFRDAQEMINHCCFSELLFRHDEMEWKMTQYVQNHTLYVFVITFMRKVKSKTQTRKLT